MNGWSIFSRSLKKLSVMSNVVLSIGEPYAGLIISRYQLENSSQNKRYTTISASDIRYFLNRSSSSALVILSLASNHFTAVLLALGCSISATSQPLTRRNAFHILLLKLRPCSHRLSSNNMSLPAGADSIIPMRTPSAPNLSINSIGSGLLPRLLLIFRPSLSRTIPVKYTFLNGILPRYS